MKPVAIVTGGTSGVGLATAQLLAENHYEIALCGRDRQRLGQAQAAIEKSRLGARVLTVLSDFEQPHTVAAVSAETFQQFGRIDVLVNSAAVAVWNPIEAITEHQLETTLNVNIRSLFALTQSVWRIMKEQGSGTIINVSSLAAVDPFAGLGVYGASKAWLDLLTKALAQEGKAFGIRVHGVQPGAIETPMLRGLFPDYPANHTLSPDDVAEAIYALLDPAWRHSSGQIVQVSRQ